MKWTIIVCLQHHLCGGAAGSGRSGGRPSDLHVARRRRSAQPAAAHEQLHPPQWPERRMLQLDQCTGMEAVSTALMEPAAMQPPEVHGIICSCWLVYSGQHSARMHPGRAVPSSEELGPLIPNNGVPLWPAAGGQPHHRPPQQPRDRPARRRLPGRLWRLWRRHG